MAFERFAVGLLLAVPLPAAAQAVDDATAATAATGARATENALRSVGDAFGTSIGRETTGLYNAGLRWAISTDVRLVAGVGGAGR